MPDIAMCDNKECPKRFTCYRFMAQPDPYWQSYSIFEPQADESGCSGCGTKCEHYMEMTKDELRREK